MRSTALLVTCEHASNAVPPAWRHLFVGAEAVLASHRGWDPGAAELAGDLAAAGGVEAYLCPVTRLLVEPNRSLGHPRLFSEFSRTLPTAQREELLASYWRPHRERVLEAVSTTIAAGSRVVHLGVHSFTPVFAGRVRNIDVAVLDDPGRPLERVWTNSFLQSLAGTDPTLRLARNRPYRGWSDGLTTTLRGLHPASDYLGLELEVSQTFPLTAGDLWLSLRRAITRAVFEATTHLAGLRDAASSH